MMADRGPCLVCGRPWREPPTSRNRERDVKHFDCTFCGRFALTWDAEQHVQSWMNEGGNRQRKAVILAYALRRVQATNDDWPLLDADWVKRIIEAGTLPDVQEQADNVVRWMATNVAVGATATLTHKEHGAIFGMESPDNFALVIDALSEFVNGHRAGLDTAMVKLTFKGWQRAAELRRGAPSGRKAFMAMQFGDPRLDRVVESCFKPAVLATGFELRRLNDNQPAGLIDDQMRVDIQGAWFLVADLTHGNRGSYWEAGYAEGFGKPVIYTCQRAAWQGEARHFDTNHHLHILWEDDKLEEAARKLKATIRATLPDARRE